MKKLRSPLLSVLAIYILCFIFRMIEYFMIRTDQTLLGEAIIHKIAGIIILWIAIKILSTDFEFIGFKRKGIFKNFAFGLLFGISVFAAAYGAEILIAVSQGVCQVFCVSFKKIFWGGEPPHLYHPTLLNDTLLKYFGNISNRVSCQ